MVMVVQAISAEFPFFGGKSLALYQPSPAERYFPFAPGIEVSVQPLEEMRWQKNQEPSVYNRQGRLNPSPRKGVLVDTCL